MRYNTAFDYTIGCCDGMDNQTIPPLMIHTFVENSIKHIVTLDSFVEIRIYISKIKRDGEDFSKISIIDTGSGFDTDILKSLQQGDQLESSDGSRVGIANCQDRMKYFYGESGKISFSNSETGGAVVEVLVPYIGRSK